MTEHGLLMTPENAHERCRMESQDRQRRPARADPGGGAVQEQRHLDAGTPEREYWHYGYMVALRDVIRLLTGQTSN